MPTKSTATVATKTTTRRRRSTAKTTTKPVVKVSTTKATKPTAPKFMEQPKVTTTSYKNGEAYNKQVEWVKPEVDLISFETYRKDFHNRMLVHNYECHMLVEDLKKVYHASRPMVNQAVDFLQDQYKVVEKQFSTGN
jgi:hypothetical protein